MIYRNLSFLDIWWDALLITSVFLFPLTFRFIISFSGNRLHLSPIALIFRKSNLVEVNITSDSPFPGMYKVRSWETTSMEDIYDDSKRFSLENLVIPISKYRPTFLVD